MATIRDEAAIRLKMLGYLQGESLADVPKIDENATVRDQAYQEAADVMGFAGPRCGFPDRADYEVAEADPTELSQDLGLSLQDAAFYVAAHRQMHAQAEANWPTSCRTSLTYGRTFRSLPGLSESETDAVWWGICNNWTAASSDLRLEAVEGVTSDPGRLDIYAGLSRLSGSTLAWQTLAVNRCDVSLEGMYDSDRTWSMVLAVTTGTHEVGHGLGHHHVQDSSALMYPSINASSQQRRGYPNSTDISQHKQLGYRLSGRSHPLNDSELWTPRNQPQPPEPTPMPDIDYDRLVRELSGNADFLRAVGQYAPAGPKGERGPAGESLPRSLLVAWSQWLKRLYGVGGWQLGSATRSDEMVTLIREVDNL